MSGEKDVMVHPSMDEMAAAFQQASQTLQSSSEAMKKQASTMEQGALLGTGGDAFREAINNHLNKKLTKLKEDMDRLNKSIKNAQQTNRATETTSKGHFTN
jgi:WXG100 family type VII secretion target